MLQPPLATHYKSQRVRMDASGTKETAIAYGSPPTIGPPLVKYIGNPTSKR